MAKGKYHYWLTDEGLLKLESWARDGLTDEQIANNMGIRISTFYDWKKKYSDISESLKKGKEIPDILVENALFKSAIGFKYTETKTETDSNGYTKTTVIEKYEKPNPVSIFYWLKNRMPNKWRDRVQVEDKTAIEKLDKLLEGIDNVATK